MKKAQLIILGVIAMLLIIILSSCSTQKTGLQVVKETQKSSWANYQDSWMDQEIEQAKAHREQKEQTEKDAKDLSRHQRKIKRIKKN